MAKHKKDTKTRDLFRHDIRFMHSKKMTRRLAHAMRRGVKRLEKHKAAIGKKNAS